MSPINRIIKDSFVSVMDKIEITLHDDDREAVYISRVEDVRDDVIVVSRPECISGNCQLHKNDHVIVQFNRPDSMYRFSALFDPIPNDKDGRVILKSLGCIERVQRREYVRISKKIELKYSLLKNRGVGFRLNALDWCDSYTRDISAGGVSMTIGEEVDVGDILLVRINDYEQMGIPRFVASICQRIMAYRKYRVGGMQFIDKKGLPKHFQPAEINNLPPLVKQFNDRIRNKMIRYIFDEQVKDRRRGMF